MHRWITALAATGALLSVSGVHARPSEAGEAKLARMTEGYLAGEPQECIPHRALGQMIVIDRTAIVYKAGDTLYVNRPRNARDLDSGDILVIDRRAHQLCSTDIVGLRSQGSPGFRMGSVFLGAFVPYRKGG